MCGRCKAGFSKASVTASVTLLPGGQLLMFAFKETGIQLSFPDYPVDFSLLNRAYMDVP